MNNLFKIIKKQTSKNEDTFSDEYIQFLLTNYGFVDNDKNMNQIRI